MIGAGVSLFAVMVVLVWNKSRQSAWEAALANAALSDPAHSALDDATKLASAGDLDRAHARLTEIAVTSPLRDSREFQDIETRWADALLGRAEHEADITARRTLLNRIAQCTTVDAGRRRVAAEKLKEADILGTDVHRLPAAAKGSTGNASSDAAAGRAASHPGANADPSPPATPGTR
jgi:hypothetical protein